MERTILLAKAMPTLYALYVVCRTTRSRARLKLKLRSSKRHIVARSNTSDIKCIEKVFSEAEYALPTEANPKFNVNPALIVDAGANIGMATLYFSHHFPNAQIYAIEPEASNFDLLKINCEGVRNITVHQAALWKDNTDLELADPNVDNWLFSVKPSNGGMRNVKALTISDILKETGSQQIDILKIDIEGAEKELFSEGSAEWLPKVKLIIIELHDRMKPGCSMAFYSRLAEHGFIQEIRGENIFALLQRC